MVSHSDAQAMGIAPRFWPKHFLTSVTTSMKYLHHLGSSADRPGLDRLNAPGARGVRARRETRNDNEKIPLSGRRSCR
jgi:hypothetical protein